MALQQTFEDIQLEQLRPLAQEKHDAGYRCVQTHCVNTEDGIDITYTFVKDNEEDVYKNYRIRGVKKGTPVPSLQDLFIGLFPFENESSDLFGVNITGMVLDFQGELYSTKIKEPMTVLSPAQLKAREKAKKLAAAKAKKTAEAAAGAGAPEGGAKPDKDAVLEAKLAGMDPDKAAKVRAAMEAKAKRDAAKKTGEEKGA